LESLVLEKMRKIVITLAVLIAVVIAFLAT
jgi:hypothetical protein